MATRIKKFDAEKYWASKPLCTVCNVKKVKQGVICGGCRKKYNLFNAKAGESNVSASAVEEESSIQPTAGPVKNTTAPVFIESKEEQEHLDQISSFLKKNPGTKAKDISKYSGLDKTDVNRLLYKFSGHFFKKGVGYTWSVDEDLKNSVEIKHTQMDLERTKQNMQSQQIQEEIFGDPVSADAQNKIVRLFTYLEKALSLDDTIVRDFRTSLTAPSPWWLSEYPRDLDNLYIKSFDTQEGVTESEQSNIWLRVQKKNIEQAPSLPEVLEEWVVEITPLNEPVALEKLDRKINFESDKSRVSDFKKFRANFQQGDEVPEVLNDWVVLAPDKLPEFIEVKYVSDNWVDHPELQNLLNGYVNNEWRKWSNKVQKVYKANLLYDQLYALRLLLKNEGDNFELLLGNGILSWKNSAVGAIYSPVFLTPLMLDFDASKRIIEISPDPMFRSFVEITPVSEMDNPAEVDLDKWMGTVNANPFDFWHLETLKSQANTFLNYLSSDSEDSFIDEISVAPALTEKPSIWNSPLIFVRKRTNSLWSKYAETIRRDMEQNGARSTEFINDLIGEYATESETAYSEESEKEFAIKESELFFPLPWNDEQKRIAERIDSNYGVVVKGPPGTGKSHTIANLIARFLAEGKSVLVTSQTSKALDVLRDKLPENIRSLAVSQLHQTAKRDDVLQSSIAEISSNLGERHTKFSESKADSIRNELTKTREEKAVVAGQIRQYILIDSTQTLKANGEELTPMGAAKFVSEHRVSDNLDWFTDNIHFETNIDFSENDLKETYQLLTTLNKSDRLLHQVDLPDVESLPNEDVMLGAFASFRDLTVKAKASNKSFGSNGTALDPNKLVELWETLNSAQKVLGTINENYEREIFDSCASSQNERVKWNTILSKISQKIEIIGSSRNKVVGHDILGKTDLSLNDLADAINFLKEKLVKNTKISTFGKLLLPANVKMVLDRYTVDGRVPDTHERVVLLSELVSDQLAEKEIKTLLSQGFSTLKNIPDFASEKLDIIQLEVLVESVGRIVHYFNDFNSIKESFEKIKQLQDLSFTKIEDINSAKDLIASTVAVYELEKLEKTFTEWATSVYDPLPITSRHKIREQLFDAIEKRSGAAWKKAVEELNILWENKEFALRLNKVSEKIIEQAPNLYNDIVALADAKHEFDCPDNLELAWKISRLESWLEHIHDHVSIDELQAKHERLSKREFQLNSDLVTVLAWQRQIDKVTKRQRDALMAWSDAMKKYGKGTGKYANKWLSSAQSSLKEAKNAVPVWIMPLHRVAQMFSDPKAGMFDVVIFDEASQCDIRGLTIGYLGKKLLVVGDPDQISPAGIFQDQERIFELISRFLYDIPHKDNFSITSSLFDLAKIRIPNMIQLNEHFRCVPEIIAFSNHHVYESKLKPLRYPHPKGLLKPALVPVLVESGYQNTNNKVNEPEARAIVEKIAELVEDPNYQQRPDGHLCTFGVISLLAEDQAKYIKELLVRHPKIGEKVIEERNIVCGDAYAFQGDERDVMFLSMVKALDPNNPNDTVRALTDKGTAQRFNVAATRGRDQVFLYHSIPVEEFRNQNDWRYRILNWYYDPKTEELESGRKALKKEFDSGRASQFSYDVGNILIDRGYQVLPEYPVIGYRIDLVVQGAEARLAVECDGDQYHTLENWEDDQVRERQLRRAGWEFWRVSGSAFYRHKEKALDSLWEKLDELGIKSVHDTGTN
jgi:very-short-patch-repair endonuclease